MYSILRGCVDSLSQTLAIAFYFTKSDIKTTLIPNTLFAVAAAPISGLDRLPHVMFWIWFHLLQFDVSNQSLQPEEDMLNKAYRPIPSGRITLRNAVRLRWLLVPTCWALSALYSTEVLGASMAFITFTILYNERSGHSGHFLIRNLVNAAGYAAFETGATLIAGGNSHTLDRTAILSIYCSAGIVATTIQAQDFKDEDGDRVIGRKTIPIVLPSIGRYTVFVPLLLWSGVLSMAWRLDFLTAAAFQTLAVFVGARFISYKSVPADQISYYWYNVWLSIAHTLPGYYRLYRQV
ncbi:hypothetical protein BV25DRAFT_1803812 [Artomyces pyxidatus]|uniref:Uncharacterized protein n=1 Tax=Artomyces pyxidatus TaxID=48021 RepID=A0ACB8T387_9AGAM|nr:hypothetical protein BV25DRAFT_1803812 [Artomyces pyxidatus]